MCFSTQEDSIPAWISAWQYIIFIINQMSLMVWKMGITRETIGSGLPRWTPILCHWFGLNVSNFKAIFIWLDNTLYRPTEILSPVSEWNIKCSLNIHFLTGRGSPGLWFSTWATRSSSTVPAGLDAAHIGSWSPGTLRCPAQLPLLDQWHLLSFPSSSSGSHVMVHSNIILGNIISYLLYSLLSGHLKGYAHDFPLNSPLQDWHSATENDRKKEKRKEKYS